MSPDTQLIRQRVESAFPARCVRSFSHQGGLDRAMVIASQALTTLIPLMIVSSTFLPSVSFTRRMQRMYLHAWQIPPMRGIQGSTTAALGLLAVLVEVAVLSLWRGLVVRLPLGGCPGAVGHGHRCRARPGAGGLGQRAAGSARRRSPSGP